MQIAICDNNSDERKKIITLLQQYFFDKSFRYEFIQYENGITLIDDFEDGIFFDIVVLDIYMNDLLGINVAKKLRSLRYNGDIIFITASSEFAIDSYDVQAIGYLLKPFDFRKLYIIMDRFIKYFNTNTYRVQKYSKIVNIPYNEILYIESDNSKCILHRSDGTTYKVYKRLNTIQDELSDKRFLRCHQSYLVNMNYIEQVDKSFILTTGDIVHIRQRTLKAIRQNYIDYISFKNKKL